MIVEPLQYYQQLDYGVKQLAEYIQQNRILLIDAQWQIPQLQTVCWLVCIKVLGALDTEVKDLCGEMNKRLLDPKGSVRINAELFSGSFSGLSTPLPAEELLAGMVCGVDQAIGKF